MKPQAEYFLVVEYIDCVHAKYPGISLHD